MKHWIFIAWACFLASCTHSTEFASRRSFLAPTQQNQRQFVEQKVLWHWTVDPKKKEKIGFLDRYRIMPAGDREWRDVWTIYNRNHQAIGFINAAGEFYRYDRGGGSNRIGEYPIFDTGLKIFFGYPLKDYLGIEDFEP